VVKRNEKKTLVYLGSLFMVILLVGITFLTACNSATATTATTATTQAPQATTATPIKLILSNYESATVYHSTDLLQPWIKEVEERSGGRIKIEAHYNEEIVKMGETYDALMKGTVDIANFIPHMVAGKFAMYQIEAFSPYNYEGYRLSRIVTELYNQFPEEQVEFEGLQPLLFYGFSSYVGTTSKAIKTLEDGKGLKMIMAGEVAAERAKALGWSPLDAPPPEVYGMFQTGVADGGGVIALGDLAGGFKWGDLIKHVTLVPTNRLCTSYAMNKAKFDSLTADLQQLLVEMMDKYADVGDKMENLKSVKDIEAAKAIGVELITLSPDETARWMAADEPVKNAYIAKLNAAGLPGDKLYNTYVELEKKYSDPQYQYK